MNVDPRMYVPTQLRREKAKPPASEVEGDEISLMVPRKQQFASPIILDFDPSYSSPSESWSLQRRSPSLYVQQFGRIVRSKPPRMFSKRDRYVIAGMIAAVILLSAAGALV